MTKLLIVDDEPYTIEMLETFLKLHGFETVAALTGEDGLVLVKVERPEAMILDLMLPDIEGFEVCRRIRSFPESARLPVLILSARADAEAKERALAAGANAYLVKPARFPVLLETLKRLLAPPVDVTNPPLVSPMVNPPVQAATPPTVNAPAPGAPAPAKPPVPGTPDSAGNTTQPRVPAPENTQPKTDPA